MNNSIRYRAYDYKSHFLQSYSGLLEGSFHWAKTCAVRFGGFVTQTAVVDGCDRGEPEIVYDCRRKK